MTYRGLSPLTSVLCAPFLALALAASATAGEWTGREEIRDGATHILNPADPLEPAQTLKPVERWRLGGDSEAEEEIFGRVEEVLIDENGLLYFLDTQLNQVRVFSPDGQYVRTLGRAGEGPGEFRNAVAHFFLPDNRLGVLQVMPSRIAVLGRDGSGLSDLPLDFLEGGAMAVFHDVAAHADLIFLSYTNPLLTANKIVIQSALVAVDGSGRKLATLKETSREQPPGPIRITQNVEEDFFRNWKIGADGRVYVAPYYQRYQIVALDPEGGPPVVIEREYESLERSETEIQEILEERKALADRIGGEEVDEEINPFKRDISRIVTRENGELWVLSGRGEAQCPQRAIGIFDVFDPKGRYVRQITLDADFDGKYDDFRIIADRLLVLKEANVGTPMVSSGGGGGGQMVMIRAGGRLQDEDREPQPFEIVCYELPR